MDLSKCKMLSQKSPTKPKKNSPNPNKAPKNFTKTQKPHHHHHHSLYFQCFEALFLLYFGRGLEKKICKFFPQKIFFMLQFHFVFGFAWQMNGKFGTEFAIRLLRQAKSESARRNEFAYFYERTYDEKIIFSHHTCAF